MDINQYEHLNRLMSNCWMKCQSSLDFAGFRRNIDEMSILLTNDELEAYKELAHGELVSPSRRTPYMKWFNSSIDTMQMETAEGEAGDLPAFKVRFEFFRGQLDETEHRALPWRVEAMTVLDGMAPLHADPNGRVVHASYKLGSLRDYTNELGRLEKEFGLKPVAHYRNAYGRFSYWENGDFPWGGSGSDKGILLKPRVNLRDATRREN